VQKQVEGQVKPLMCRFEFDPREVGARADGAEARQSSRDEGISYCRDKSCAIEAAVLQL
jgi:hypothetical protein